MMLVIPMDKGARAVALGTQAIWSGRKYEKTAEGWKTVGKDRVEKIKAKMLQRKAKLFHKEMRTKYGGGWAAGEDIKAKETLVDILIKQGKAKKKTLETGVIAIQFLKAIEELEC